MRTTPILNHRGVPVVVPTHNRVKARYEAAIPSRSRGFVWEQLWDSEYDLSPNSWTLTELAKASRYLWKNDPIFRGLIERIITYTIGCGINPLPASSDRAWNVAVRQGWENARDYIDYSRECSWGTTLAKLLREKLLAGNVFAILVESPVTQKARIQIACIERLKEIRYDANGRATGYRFYRRNHNGDQGKSLDDVVHFLNDKLANAKMGEPLLAAALNTCRDMAETMSYEKEAVKDASKTKDILETESGEMDPSELVSNHGTDLAGADGLPLRYYRRADGSETMLLRAGEKYVGLEPKRPGPAWQGFMMFMAEAVCIAAGFPPSFVLPTKATGPTVRENMAAVARAVEQLQDELKCGIRRIFFRWVETEVELGLLPPPPEDYRRLRWQVPSNPTIDAGRESQQRREDVKMGLLSKEEYWGDTGQFDEAEEDKVIEEAKRLKEKLHSAGLSLAEFQSLLSVDATAEVEIVGRGEEDGEEDKSSEGGVATNTSGEDVQKQALNGAQLAAMQEILEQVSQKQLSPEAATMALQIALPFTDASQIVSMVNAAAAFQPAVIEEPEKPTQTDTGKEAPE